MMTFADIGWANTFLPLGALAALALALPFVTVPRATRSQARLAVGVAASALVRLVAGTGLFAGLYAGEGGAPRPAAVLRATGMAAIVWAPLLALAWFVRAQGVERRRGEDMAQAGRLDAGRPGGENGG
jgi:hypothetical protein